jgi:hypothetical protein
VLPGTDEAGVNEAMSIEHIVWVFEGFVTTGTGSIVTVKVNVEEPAHKEGAGPEEEIT